jgi:hypothetical protein
LNDPKAQPDWLKVDGMDALVELALDLHWSWNHAADELWEGLDKELWASTQNPWVILRTVSHEKIKAALSAPEFRRRLDSLLRKNRESYRADAWFQHKHPGAALSTIAYFSMEFMLSEALPIYSGGLGNVALWAGIFPPGFRCGRPATGTLSGQRSGAVADPAAATAKWRVVAFANSTSRLKDLASLLGGVSRENKAVSPRRQRLCQYRGSSRYYQ